MIWRNPTREDAKTLKFVVREQGQHLHVTLFEAPMVPHGDGHAPGTFANCGTLTMREPEWSTLRNLVMEGARHLGFEVTVDERGAGLGVRSIL